MLIGIIFITASFAKLAKLDAVDGFVIVHRPLIKPGTANPEGQEQNAEKSKGSRLQQVEPDATRFPIFHSGTLYPPIEVLSITSSWALLDCG